MKTVIVDDHAIIRIYLKHYLEHNFPAFNVSVLLANTNINQEIITLQPQLAILEISLEKIDCTEIFVELKTALPQTFFIIYTMHNNKSYKDFFWKNGAHAYILKEEAEADLKDVIVRVLNGERVFSGECAETNNAYRLNQLNFSTAEKDLLSQLLITLDTDEIASKLSWTKKQVLDSKRLILARCGAANTQELLQFIIDYNWIR